MLAWYTTTSWPCVPLLGAGQYMCGWSVVFQAVVKEHQQWWKSAVGVGWSHGRSVSGWFGQPECCQSALV